MNLAELRTRLEIAAAHKPALKKLLTGNIESKEDLEQIAQATAELGMFELSFLVRAIASGEERFDEGLAKLALFASSVSDDEVMTQLASRVENGNPELAGLLRTFGKLVK